MMHYHHQKNGHTRKTLFFDVPKRGPSCPNWGEWGGFRWFGQCPKENVFFCGRVDVFHNPLSTVKKHWTMVVLTVENELSGQVEDDDVEPKSAWVGVQVGDDVEPKSECSSLTPSLSLCLQPLRKGVNWPEPAETTKKNLASDQPFKYFWYDLTWCV